MRSISCLPRGLLAVAAVLCGASNLGAQVVYNPGTGNGYVLTPPLTFAGARAAAAAMGGHLVSVGDAAEQSFVANTFLPSFVSPPVWIGLSDEAAEGTFLWDDATPFAFSAWLPGEPGPLGGADDAVTLGLQFSLLGFSTGWADASAGMILRGVVELGPPPGDTCATAVPVPADGVYPYDSGAGFAPSAPSSPCSQPGGPDPLACWFAYVAPANGTLVVSNCPASTLAPGGGTTVEADTYLSAWAGGVCPPTVFLGCADESPGCSVVESELSFAVTAGSTYLIQVGAWGQPAVVAGSAAFRLYPADDCANATALSLGVNGPFDNAAATDDVVQLVACEFTARDVWFSYVSPTDAFVTITTARPDGFAAGTLADPNLAVYDSCGGNVLACADGYPYDVLTATVYAAANQTLLLRVAGWAGQTGSFFLTLSSQTRLLRMASPLGAGSLRIENLGGDPFGGYVTVLTLNAGGFPHGYFAGIDPSPTELFLQLVSGVAPFVGQLDAAGSSSFGPVAGLPPLTLYGATVFLAPFGLPAGFSPPVAYAIP